jgi:hypothetical protein
MNTRQEKEQPGKSGANPSKRDRLESLLFSSAKVGTALLGLAVLVGPKVPPLAGE